MAHPIRQHPGQLSGNTPASTPGTLTASQTAPQAGHQAVPQAGNPPVTVQSLLAACTKALKGLADPAPAGSPDSSGSPGGHDGPGTLACAASPRLEAEILLAHVLGKDRIWLRIHGRDMVSPEHAEACTALCARRAAGEPSAYLTGTREFFGRDFAVCPGVLIPRPETELVVETALELTQERHRLRMADLGAGSGCIGISLALERRGVTGCLVEKSPVALRICAANAARLGAEHLLIIQADMRHLPLPARSLNLVVANPPYIARDDAMVAPMVRKYEPEGALFADHAGLALLEACIAEAKRTLAPGGWIVLEHGCSQGEAVRNLLQAQGFYKITTKRDLGGLDRVTHASI